MLLWRLQKLHNGIFEPGRQWICAIDNWILQERKFNRVPGVDQLFVSKSYDAMVCHFMAKVVDDFFVVGPKYRILDLFKALYGVFALGASRVDEELRFLVCGFDIADYRSVMMNINS